MKYIKNTIIVLLFVGIIGPSIWVVIKFMFLKEYAGLFMATLPLYYCVFLAIATVNTFNSWFDKQLKQ